MVGKGVASTLLASAEEFGSTKTSPCPGRSGAYTRRVSGANSHDLVEGASMNEGFWGARIKYGTAGEVWRGKNTTWKDTIRLLMWSHP